MDLMEPSIRWHESRLFKSCRWAQSPFRNGMGAQYVLWCLRTETNYRKDVARSRRACLTSWYSHTPARDPGTLIVCTKMTNPFVLNAGTAYKRIVRDPSHLGDTKATGR